MLPCVDSARQGKGQTAGWNGGSGSQAGWEQGTAVRPCPSEEIANNMPHKYDLSRRPGE